MTLVKPQHHTIVGTRDEVGAAITRAQEDHRLVDLLQGPIDLPDGKVAVTVSLLPAPRSHISASMWQWLADGGVVWLGIGAVALVASSTLVVFVSSVLYAWGYYTNEVHFLARFFMNYGIYALVAGFFVLLFTLVGGARGSSGPHCPGPWHR